MKKKQFILNFQDIFILCSPPLSCTKMNIQGKTVYLVWHKKINSYNIDISFKLLNYRTDHVRQSKVFAYFLEFICGMFCIFFIFDRALIPEFRKFNVHQISLVSLVNTLFACLFPASLIKLFSKTLSLNLFIFEIF